MYEMTVTPICSFVFILRVPLAPCPPLGCPLLPPSSISLNRWRCQWISTETRARVEPVGSFACSGLRSCLFGSQRFPSWPDWLVRLQAGVKERPAVTGAPARRCFSVIATSERTFCPWSSLPEQLKIQHWIWLKETVHPEMKILTSSHPCVKRNAVEISKTTKQATS